MLLFTNGNGPLLVLWQIHCKQDFSPFFIIRQIHCKQVLSLLVAKFWFLGQKGNFWALYQGRYICNLGNHAQDACLNFVRCFHSGHTTASLI
jgi:hypothetical protein